MSKFQIILITVFSFFIFIGILLFATSGGGSEDSVGKVVIWGTVKKEIINSLLNNLKDKDKSFNNVNYEEKNPQTFDADLVEAIASETGPDVFLLPQSKILDKRNKVVVIPYTNFSERDFKNYFIEEGELYLTKEGVLALPLIIDPLVMYWNRSIFANAGVANPPQFWDEFLVLAKKITRQDDNKNILLSAVPFGEFSNVDNAKEILATLILQTGNPIVMLNKKDEIKISLRDVYNGEVTPVESALRFYTEFSNPVKETYSWNRAMPDSQMAFLSGDLGIYFGFASELKELKLKNPNLNFDVAYMPQTQNLKNNLTFGNMQALAISRGSKNVAGAFRVITNLIQAESLLVLNQITGLPPVSRVLLDQGTDDPYQEIFYKSALSAQAFFDLDEKETELIFQDMVDGVVSGRRSLSQAVSWANAELEELVK